jgi:hypothetical protein
MKMRLPGPHKNGKYACPCCGYYTLLEGETGSYDICEVCFWEDDFVQAQDPKYRGGANHPSLLEARKNYEELSACEARGLTYVRKPLDEEGPRYAWE